MKKGKKREKVKFTPPPHVGSHVNLLVPKEVERFQSSSTTTFMSTKGAALSAEVQSLVLDQLHQLHPNIIDWRLERKEVYHLLTVPGCGPQSFFALAYHHPGKLGKEEAFNHIITTNAMPDFCMASDEDNAESLHLLTMEDTMCLILLVCCFRLGDIPANTNNWGTTTSGRLAAWPCRGSTTSSTVLRETRHVSFAPFKDKSPFFYSLFIFFYWLLCLCVL